MSCCHNAQAVLPLDKESLVPRVSLHIANWRWSYCICRQSNNSLAVPTNVQDNVSRSHYCRRLQPDGCWRVQEPRAIFERASPMSDEDKPSRLQPGHGVPLSPCHVSRLLLVVPSPVCPLSTKRSFYPGCRGEMISGFPIWFIVQAAPEDVEGSKDEIRKSHVYLHTAGMLHILGRLFTFVRHLSLSKAHLIYLWMILFTCTSIIHRILGDPVQCKHQQDTRRYQTFQARSRPSYRNFFADLVQTWK